MSRKQTFQCRSGGIRENSTVSSYPRCFNLSNGGSSTEDAVILDYIFIDHTKLDVKVKTKVVDKEPNSIAELPLGHASIIVLDLETKPLPEHLSELLLVPVALYNDPFRGQPHKIVLCEVMKDLTTPSEINTRHGLVSCATETALTEPLVGFEQEYVISGEYRKQRGAFPKRLTYDNCVGCMAAVHLERSMAEEHMTACIKAGLHFCGMNREKAESQWEYQLGPASPVTMADDLVVSRYLLSRIAEKYDVTVTFDPAPDTSMFTSALHLNFSSREMRENGGLANIKRTLENFMKLPQEQLMMSFDRRGGKDNARRLVGHFSRPPPSDCVIGNKNASSVRIPEVVKLHGKGYFEERRPSADADPYTVLRTFLESMSNAIPKC